MEGQLFVKIKQNRNITKNQAAKTTGRIRRTAALPRPGNDDRRPPAQHLPPPAKA
ncbi:MAG: hypothetical protein ACLRM8_02795 [Alistipes sp.]